VSRHLLGCQWHHSIRPPQPETPAQVVSGWVLRSCRSLTRGGQAAPNRFASGPPIQPASQRA
jgi:hypothetical protein